MAKSLTKEENILLTLINAFQNDEKEKLNRLGNISKSLIEVRKIVKEEMEKLPPQFNILNLIRRKNSEGRLLTYEPYNSDLIYQLLNIKKKNINFVKLFLEFMNGKFENKIDLNNIDWKKATVGKEYGIKVEREDRTTNRRIDLIIYYNDKEKSFAVIIENKTKRETGDQDSQIKDYYDKISKNYKNVYAIYLTPEGKLPSENSLPKNYYDKKLYGKLANIRHAEIGYWLESILKRQEFSFLNNEEENNKYNYKLLKSALIQIIDNEKSISGENTEGDMTKPKVEKVLEKELFQKIKNKDGNIETDEIQSYIDMFQNQVIPLLEKKIAENRKAIIEKDIKPCLKFTKEVTKYLKSQGYKENKDYNLLKDEDIINNMSEKDCYSHHIEFDINNIGVWLESCCNEYSSDISYHFGIFTDDSNAITKIIKKLKNSIKNIFSDFEYNENEEWIFVYYINTEKDNPQRIAQAMIDLYELLKKEIK